MNVQPTNDRVDPILERYANSGSPGRALAVMQDGEIVHKRGYGLVNLEHGVPIVLSTVFDVGLMANRGNRPRGQ